MHKVLAIYDEKKEEEKVEEPKKEEEDTKMETDTKPEEKKDDTKTEEKKDTEEAKKEETKPEEKKEEVKDDVVEIIEEEKKVPEEPVEIDFVAKLDRFVQFINWDHTDAPYYLKEVRGKKVLSTEHQNEAMTKMLESFVAMEGKRGSVFRGRVPLSSIEDAWKVKVAGRMFQLKELEELCTKFLQYRIDSRNLIHFLKNTIKYDTPDLRDVISRLLKTRREERRY